MKKKIIFSLVVFAITISFTACKKIVAAVFKGMDVSVPEMQFTIPAIFGVAPGEIPLGSYPYKFNLDSVVRANTGGAFGAGSVTSIKVKQVNINVSNADQLNNLANFETARITIQSNTNNNPVEFFSVIFADVFASAYTSPNPSNVELLSYLKGTDIVYKIYAKNRRTTSKPLDFKISVIVRVN